MTVLAKWPTPARHRMGYTINPADGVEIPFYADCADCGAHEPEIAGHLGEDAPPHRPMILVPTSGPAFAREALYCATCFAPKWERTESVGAESASPESVGAAS